MSDRQDPALPAPFVSSVMRIEPAWIDYNGHLNVAYYNVLFDRAVDEIYEPLGLGPGYLERTKHSTMVVETHVRYLREVHLDTPLRVTIQLLAYDAKRIQLFEQLVHATEGWVSATSESMTVHVDMTAKKVSPFPADVLAALERMQAAHATLPRPDAAGRSVGMPVRA
ncbi:MAG: thioesterase [Rhodopseudomonas sp.]|nr:thioesterase [Rhodopseudomonas sp.]